MGKPKTPAVPDPVKTLEAGAKYNRVDQYNPWGESVYGRNPDGSYRLDTNISPELMGLYGNALSTAQDPYQIRQGQPPPGQNDLMAHVASGQYVPGMYGTDNQYTQAAFNNAKSLLDPVYEQQQRTLDQKLANQGLPTGGEAYNRAMETFNRGRDLAYNNAAFQAINSGDQRAANQFNQQNQGLSTALNAGIQRYNLGEQQRQYDNTADAQRAQMLYSMASGLMGLVPKQTPGSLDVQGAYNAAQAQSQANANAMNQYNQNLYGNIGKFVPFLFM